MSVTTAEARPHNNLLIEMISFAIQAAIAVGFEVGDDLTRGLVSQHGTVEGIDNARQIVSFEAVHGFWIEPAWQIFFEQTHHILAFTLTWSEASRMANGIYVLGHVFVTLGVALWVYFWRRPFFGLLRNIFLLTNGFALVVYESFPVAPPRLTTGLSFAHHPFTFQDTVFGIVSAGGKLVGTQSGFNEFSAMPSVHMAWAMIVAAAVIWLARSSAAKLLAALYPALMLVAVVVTGNHYLLDVAGAIPVVLAAVLVAVVFDHLRKKAAEQCQAERPQAA